MGTSLQLDHEPFFTHHCTNPRCGWEGTLKQVEAECVYRGSLEEPPEFVDKCPDCGALRSMEEVELCVGCNDANKYEDGKDDYDYCLDCLVSAAEAMAEGDR